MVSIPEPIEVGFRMGTMSLNWTFSYDDIQGHYSVWQKPFRTEHDVATGPTLKAAILNYIAAAIGEQGRIT
jgi:hypothetical protein